MSTHDPTSMCVASFRDCNSSPRCPDITLLLGCHGWGGLLWAAAAGQFDEILTDSGSDLLRNEQFTRLGHGLLVSRTS